MTGLHSIDAFTAARDEHAAAAATFGGNGADAGGGPRGDGGGPGAFSVLADDVEVFKKKNRYGGDARVRVRGWSGRGARSAGKRS